MKPFQKFLVMAGLQLVALNVLAGQAQVQGLNFVTDADGSRLVFDMPVNVGKGVFLLNKPERLVIDLKNTRLSHALPQPPENHPLFTRVRSAARNNTDLRIVVDLKKPFSQKQLKISADNSAKHIVVGVLSHANAPLLPEKMSVPLATEVADNADSKNIFSKMLDALTSKASELTAKNNKENTAVSKDAGASPKEVVIAIDAGHGGIDTGAIGRSGTQEKRVVFAIAKKLEELINQQPGMKAIMVRKGDYYIPLRKRMVIAREAKADLFVSIHADAIKDSNVSGASVYTLSNDGASSEAARWLADNENAADLIGGVSLDDKDDVLASVLIDLSQSATKEASHKVASKILKSFNTIGKLHKNEVQKAGFMVLKSPDIPSILIETAFISNPTEENELRNTEHQEKVATAVFQGIDNYFREHIPVTTRMASSQ